MQYDDPGPAPSELAEKIRGILDEESFMTEEEKDRIEKIILEYEDRIHNSGD